MSFSRWLGRGAPGLPRTVPSRRTCARLLRPRFRPCARARRSLDPSKFRVFPCPVPCGVRNALGISRFLSPFFYALCLAFLPLFFPKSKRLDTPICTPFPGCFQVPSRQRHPRPRARFKPQKHKSRVGRRASIMDSSSFLLLARGSSSACKILLYRKTAPRVKRASL